MIAFTVPPPNHADPDYTPAGPVMFSGVNATIIADPGDEDRRLVFRDWLDLFAFAADNGRDLGDRLTAMLVAECTAWRDKR